MFTTKCNVRNLTQCWDQRYVEGVQDEQAVMSHLKLTPAQRRFIDQFDVYTRRGTEPQDYKALNKEWHIQFRTMNWCVRTGLLQAKKKEKDNGEAAYVVNPLLRNSLGLPQPIFKTKFLRPRKRLSRAC